MSETEDRRKVKAKRFNKFESTSRNKEIGSHIPAFSTSGTQGVKRHNSFTDESPDMDNPKFKKKKYFHYNVLSPPATKNLANTRLQVLREKIHSSPSNTVESKPQDKVITTPPPVANPSVNTGSSSKRDKFITTPPAVANTSVNTGSSSKRDKVITTPPAVANASVNTGSLSKNFANNRLRNVRKNIKVTKDELKKTPEQIKLEKQKQVTNDSLRKIKESVNASLDYPITSTKDFPKHQQNVPSPIVLSFSDCSMVTIDETFQDKTIIQQSPELNIPSNVKSTNTLSLNRSNINKGFSKTDVVHSSSPLLTSDKVTRRFQRISSTKPYNLPDRLKLNSEKIDKNCVNNNNEPKVTSVPDTQHGGLHLPPDTTFFDKMTWTSRWIANIEPNTSSVFSTLANNSNISTNAVCEDNDRTLRQTDVNDDDEMEWTNAEPEESPQIPLGSKAPDVPQSNISKPDSPNVAAEKSKLEIKDLCLVVDTNILISNLDKIEELMKMKVDGIFKPIIYIPWMVINELDYIKDNYNEKKLKSSAQKAIKFINMYLSQQHPRLKGQNVYDVEKQQQIGTSPDDKIVACCLQTLERYETVILVSNDVNLRNKALINNVPVCSANEVRMKVMVKLHTSVKAQKILKKMELFCSSMISHFAKVTFGNAWTKMDPLKHPPWPVSECLQKFKKYWFTMFKDKLLKHFQRNLDELQNMLNNDNCFCDNTPEYEEFKMKCIEICVHFKDVEEVRGFAQNTIDEIKKL